MRVHERKKSETDRQADRQTGRQTDRQADRQTKTERAEAGDRGRK